MSEDEIRKIVEKVFFERTNSAITRMTNMLVEYDTRKDLETKEGSIERKALQNEINKLDLLIMLLKFLKGN